MRNQKISALLCLATVALHCGLLQGMDSIKGNCNEIIRLPCTATDRTHNYRYVIWYKIKTDGKTAVIKKKNHNITLYNYTNSVTLGEKETLVLHGVNSLNSGVYECFLAADVGGTNEESLIRLNISECVNLTTVYPTSMSTTPPPAVIELSVSWALLCFSLFSLAKIILCIIFVGVSDHVIFGRIKTKKQVGGCRTGARSSQKY